MKHNIKDFKFYADVLKNEECQCGRNKQPGRSFCYMCFKSLPKELIKPLYQPIGDGYEEAYEEAVRYLT
jgi:hypothetical protein